MGFGALRVINDDIIESASGFGMHPHKDMEIITIVMEGAVTHKDSMGNVGTVTTGEVQVMSAGTGVVHSEYNDSPDAQLKLFQIWIFPTDLNIAPRYEQQTFGEWDMGGFETLVGPLDSDAPLTIAQDAYISRAQLEKGGTASYDTKIGGNGLYLFVVEGSVMIEGEELGLRDAIGLWDMSGTQVVATADAKVLCIEVPMP